MDTKGARLEFAARAPGAWATRSARLMASILVLTVVAAACSSKTRLTKVEYQQKFVTIGKDLTTTIQKVFSNPALQNPSSVKQVADIIRDGVKTIPDASEELEGLNPPSDFDS